MVKNVQGKRPGSEHAVKNAVERVSAAGPKGIAVTRYANLGRRYGADGGKYLLTAKQAALVVHPPGENIHTPPRGVSLKFVLTTTWGGALRI